MAHGLEMDLIGTGKSPAEAVAELRGNVAAQLAFFARQQGSDPFRQAPEEIQQLWNQGNLAALSPAANGAPRNQVLRWTSSEILQIPADPFIPV